MDKEIEQFRKQHFDNYKKAIVEHIRKNTSTLVDEDIMSLFKKPPLETMDLIKSKFLDIAKKEKKILSIDVLDNVIDNYRKRIISCLSLIKKTREDALIKKVDNFKYDKKTSTFKISKKDFSDINKKNRSLIKETMVLALQDEIIDKVDNIFNIEDNTLKNKMKEEASKYLKGNYQKGILENIDFKVIVKDTTLINGIKEQTERYLFTINNSRLLNEDLES